MTIKKRFISMVLVIFMMIGVLPINLVEASNQISNNINLRSDKEYIKNGSKGIDYKQGYIDIEYNNLKLKKNINTDNIKNYIDIFVNGQRGVDDFKLDITDKDNNGNKLKNKIRIKVKQDETDGTHMKPFILRKHSLYNIQIKDGLFIGKDNENTGLINYTFTTKGDGDKKDIIKNTLPKDKETYIDYKNGRIVVEFIDDIEINDKNRFDISALATTNPMIDQNYEKIDKSRFELSIEEGNKLIFKAKDGKLKKFAEYRINIHSNLVLLKNSKFIEKSTIYNDNSTIRFYTNPWIEDWEKDIFYNYLPDYLGTPNKAPIMNKENIHINPIIQIKFKNNLNIKNKNKIKLTSDGKEYAIDNEDIYVDNKNTLKLDINSMYRKGKYPLRKNTYYKITIEDGALGLYDYDKKVYYTGTNSENEELNIYFKTGNEVLDEDEGLKVKKYTSDKDINHDDIAKFNDTKLDKDGNIYIHFNRDIKWNEKYKDKKNKGFKIYKIPQANKTDYDSKGVLYDKEFIYKEDYTNKSASKTEVPIEDVKVEIVDKNIIKIELKHIDPKYALENLGRYLIVQDYDDMILSKEHGQNLRVGINQLVWTKPSNDKRVDWNFDDIKPEDVIENTNSGALKVKRYGTPKYNEYIDNEAKAKPIILNVNGEVVPNIPEDIKDKSVNIFEHFDIEGVDYPYKADLLSKIELREEHNTDKNNKHKIKWYKLEYYFDSSGKKNTSVSLYPEGELDSGKSYHLSIEKGTFITRGEETLKGLDLHFVVEGKNISDRGVNKVEITKGLNGSVNIKTDDFLEENYKEALRIEENNLIELAVKGYNFTEDIRSVKFVRDIDGKVINMDKKLYKDPDNKNDKGEWNIEFKNVDEIRIKLRGDILKELSKKGNGGTYQIEIEFENGSRAEFKGNGQRFILYDKPMVFRTNPKHLDKNVNINDLLHTFTNSDSGHYLTVIFNDINNKLEYTRTLNELDGFILKEYGSSDNDNLIDDSRNIVIESPTSEDSKESVYKHTIESKGTIVEEINTKYDSATMHLDKNFYEVGDKIKITIKDKDMNEKQNIREEVKVSVSVKTLEDSSEQTTLKEEVVLTETSVNSGKFEGSITIGSSEQEINAKVGDRVTIEYIDENTAFAQINNEIVRDNILVVKDKDQNSKARLYMDKSVYEDKNTIKITLIDHDMNKKNDEKEIVAVDLHYKVDSGEYTSINNEIKLEETGKNTGEFEAYIYIKDNKLNINHESNNNDIKAEESIDGLYINDKFDFKISHEDQYKVSGANKDGEFKIHIPIKNEFQGDTDYEATIPKDIVKFNDDLGLTTDSNSRFIWTFKTSAGPKDINVDSSFKGSAPQEYDRNFKIVLNGENFDENTRVYFRSVAETDKNKKTEARLVEVSDDGKKLDVYLPMNNRLAVGLYNILVGEEDNLKLIEDGVLSVVVKGDYVPNEDFKQEDAKIDDKNTVEGGLKEISKTSKNQLELPTKYTSKELDLDSILGLEVLIREIKHDGNSIATLNTKSKWADIKLKGLSRDSSSQPMTIRLGRAEPAVSDSIKKKLVGDSIKSDFIQISGENYKISSAELSIPYKESNGNNLKVLRYDEDTRRIGTNISFRVDKANKKVQITNAKKGIYVIVE